MARTALTFRQKAKNKRKTITKECKGWLAANDINLPRLAEMMELTPRAIQMQFDCNKGDEGSEGITMDIFSAILILKEEMK